MQQALAYILLPGERVPIKDIVNNPTTAKTSKRDLDINSDMSISAKHAGWLWTQEENNQCKIAIFHNPIYYTPELDDFVIATITGKNSECYFCTLGNGLTYNLNQMDFEGATKKNRPNLMVGQLVYARVAEVSMHLKGKLSCINPKSKKEWTSGESLFRELNQGVVIDVPISFTEQLLSKQQKPEMFKALGFLTSFEVCVGKNGKIWVKGDHADLIINLLKKAVCMSEAEQLALVKQFSPLFEQ